MAFVGELRLEGLPLVKELLVDAFAVWRAACAIPRADHNVHVEGPPPPHWKFMPCKRVGKLHEDAQDLT